MSVASLEDQFTDLLRGGPADPYPLYSRLREGAPIFHSDATGGWVVSRRDDVARVLEDEGHFGPLQSGAGSSRIHGRVILHMSGTEHRKKRALLSHRLRSPRLLADVWAGRVRTLTTELLDAIDFGSVVDLKPALTTPLPLQITAELMGIPEAPRFRTWYDTIVAAGASNLTGDPEVLRRGEEARAELFAFLRPVIAQRRRDPGDDLLSDLCTFEYEGEPLHDDEILGFCSFLLAAGVETTDRSLSSMLKLLFMRRDVWEGLRADRDSIAAACAEILRWAPPVHGVSRGVLASTELAGRPVEAGDRVFVLIASANRDPEHFADAEEFKADRFSENPHREFTPKASILPFGAGRHHCTGSLLAKLEMEEAINQLLDRVAWAEFDGDPPDDVGYVLRSPRHVRVTLQAAG
jgi:cytochrome P450